jgi:hypothetical protein
MVCEYYQEPDEFEEARDNARAEIEWHLLMVGSKSERGEASSSKEFYQSAAELIRRARELSDEQRNQLADVVSEAWEREGRGAPRKSDRDRAVYIRCFTNFRSGAKKGDPRPAKSECIDWIIAEYRMTRDAARKLYERLESGGIP